MKDVYNKRIKMIVLTFPLLIFITFLFSGCKDDSNEKVAIMMESIKKDLSVGLSIEEVKSYLNRSDIEYSYEDKTKSFTCIKRDISSKGPVSASLSIEIQMDGQGKLKDLNVRPVYTGP